MASKFVYAAGVFFVLLGFVGFCEWVSSDWMMFGLIAVNPVHNVVHLATGALALGAAYIGGIYPKVLLRVIAVVYGLQGAAYLIVGGSLFWGLLLTNFYGALLHLGIGAGALYASLGCPGLGGDDCCGC